MFSSKWLVLLLLTVAVPAAAQQITFVETDTAGTASSGCSALAAGLVQVNLQMVKSGTAGSATQTPDIDISSTEAAITWIAPAGSPGAKFWPGGQTSGNEWSVSINVTVANSLLSWTELDICADNGGTFTTIKSDTALNISLGTTGVKTAVETVTSGTAEGSGVIPFIVIGVKNSDNGSDDTFSFLSSQNILSPLVTSPTFIQPSGASGIICINSTSCTSSPFTITGGNELIACADAHNTSAVLSVSDSNGGNTWKIAVTNTIGTPYPDVGECWYAPNSVSGSYTFKISSTVSADLQMDFGEWSYVDPTANALDCAAAGGNASSTAVDSGACNATSNHLPELAIGYASIAVGGSVTAGSGWTQRITIGSGHGYLEDRVVSTAGNWHATMTPGSSGNWMATGFSLAQYGAAPPASCPKGMLAMMGVGCG